MIKFVNVDPRPEEYEKEARQFLAKNVPAALTKGHHPTQIKTDNYQNYSTWGMMKVLMDKGFKLDGGFQRSPNKRTAGTERDFSKFATHMIWMHNPALSDKEGNYQVVLKNSHDGITKFSASVGFFRLVCENGLVIPTPGKENVTMTYRRLHLDLNQFEVLEVILDKVKEAEYAANIIAQMKETMMSAEQQKDFAKKALAVRFKEEQLLDYADRLLEVIRPEDEGDNLWVVYNRVQEKLIDGEFSLPTLKDGKVGTDRAVQAIRAGFTQHSINSKLANIASEYLPGFEPEEVEVEVPVMN